LDTGNTVGYSNRRYKAFAESEKPGYCIFEQLDKRIKPEYI